MERIFLWKNRGTTGIYRVADKEKKKRGFLSKLGFKSKEDKLAAEAAEKAAKQKLVDEQMAARMAAINAAALKSAREQDVAAQPVSAEAEAAIEAEEKRLAEIQAAKDVARAKQLAEEKLRKEEEAKAEAEAAAKRAEETKARAEEKARLDAEAAAKKAAEAKARAEEKAKLEAEEIARRDAEAKARAEEVARLKAEEDAALEKARKEQGAQEAAALQAKQEAEAKARAEAEAKRLVDEQQAAEEARIAAEKAEEERLEAEARAEEEACLAADKAEAERLAAEEAATEKAKTDRLRKEAEEAERRAAIAAQQAERDAMERDAAEEARQKALADAPAPEIDTLAEGGFFTRITKGLSKSTSKMSENMSSMFNKRTLDDEALEDLQDLLIASDLGVGPAMKVSALLAKDKFDKQVTDMEIKIALADVISEILTPLEKPLVLTSAKPQIMLFVGVNGSGKTTTLGKLAKRYTDQGKKVMLAAGDTFRAAAVEQLTVWGERSGAPVVSGKLGADAAGLVFDAIEQAKAENYDILMIDTAGRLQNRTELMDELAKVVRVIKKADPAAPHHCVLVLDATVGQNALQQTEVFRDVAGVTGLIMTKLDGTAKGGVLVALSDKFALPIHHIGIGERIQDLENFSAPVFAAALSGVADAMVET